MQQAGSTRERSASRRAVVVVFGRLPRPGRVKTRLAAGVGPERAAAFYKLCAEHAFEEVCRCAAVDGAVFCAAAEDVPGVAAWLQRAATPLPVAAQVPDDDLGRRMLSALTSAATQPVAQGASPGTVQGQQQQQQQYEAAIVIGTDIPDLSSGVLAKAAAALLGGTSASAGAAAPAAAAGSSAVRGQRTGPPAGLEGQQPAAAPGAPGPDMVLGPAADGGYYLLGLRTDALLRPDVQAGRVFEGVTWSCGSVLERTLAAARALGLRVAPLDTLPVLRDIDTAQDAAAWLDEQMAADEAEAAAAAAAAAAPGADGAGAGGARALAQPEPGGSGRAGQLRALVQALLAGAGAGEQQ